MSGLCKFLLFAIKNRGTSAIAELKTSRFVARNVATNGDAGGDAQFKLSLAAESMVPQFVPGNFFVCMGTQTALIFFVDTEV